MPIEHHAIDTAALRGKRHHIQTEDLDHQARLDHGVAHLVAVHLQVVALHRPFGELLEQRGPQLVAETAPHPAHQLEAVRIDRHRQQQAVEQAGEFPIDLAADHVVRRCRQPLPGGLNVEGPHALPQTQRPQPLRISC